MSCWLIFQIWLILRQLFLFSLPLVTFAICLFVCLFHFHRPSMHFVISSKIRSNRPKWSKKKAVLRYLEKFTEKTCKLWKIVNNTYFTESVQITASDFIFWSKTNKIKYLKTIFRKNQLIQEKHFVPKIFRNRQSKTLD